MRTNYNKIDDYKLTSLQLVAAVTAASTTLCTDDGSVTTESAFQAYNTYKCCLRKCKGAVTSKIKHAIKLKTSPGRLAQLITVAALISVLF